MFFKIILKRSRIVYSNLGYSFTNSCYVTSQKEVASDLYDALMQFFQLFPSLKKNDFYVTGESYAGKYVPAISYKIHSENKMKANNKKPRDVINLKVCDICYMYFARIGFSVM